MAKLNFFFWVRTDKQKWEILQEKAKQLKDEKPDKAIQLMKKSEKLMKKADFKPVSLLGIRLAIVTILYEHERNEEAERMLLDEFEQAKKWKIGRHEVKAAEKIYKERLKSLYNLEKTSGEKIRDYDLKKELNEFPDFERNLYCMDIYKKMRIFYERTKQYEKAVPFALAEVYTQYENHIHVSSKYGDPISPDFKSVLRSLKKLGRETDMQRIETVFSNYMTEPDSTNCWHMIDEVRALLG